MTKSQYEYSIQPEWFLSQKKKCRALFYKPQKTSGLLPVILMAHGFGVEMSCGLHPFAEKFVQEGMAVLMFDYRGFGESEGLPRNLVHPFKHLQDWNAALNHVKGLPGIDPDRIALWGTSFSGGHVLTLAADNPDVKAVSAQVPFLDGRPTSSPRGIMDMLKLTWAAFRDIARMMTFRSPYYIPIVGKPGHTATMNEPDSLEGMLSLIPEDSKWKNKCAARICLLMGFYNPIKSLSKIQCPCLLINAENDSLFLPKTIPNAAKKIKDCEFVNLNCGHFDPYTGIHFEKTIASETRFFKKHLIEETA